ncbi:hypothetical protein [Streptodolium elevatio]|uniref:Uncharacterized protein n=1 Tax=Streptodolium elevatio TaxID=3157996 RepID=A0ABV3DIC1_9ACTN
MCVGVVSSAFAGLRSGAFYSTTIGYDSSACYGGVLKPTGWLSVEQVVLAYNMATRQWFECSRLGPRRNEAPAETVRLQNRLHGTRLCGTNRWYATFTAAYGWDGAAWRGAWLGSGNEWVAA